MEEDPEGFKEEGGWIPFFRNIDKEYGEESATKPSKKRAREESIGGKEIEKKEKKGEGKGEPKAKKARLNLNEPPSKPAKKPSALAMLLADVPPFLLRFPLFHSILNIFFSTKGPRGR